MPSLQSSDAEIDAALDRLLGPFGGATLAAAPPASPLASAAAAVPPAPPAAPALSGPSASKPLDVADPLGLSLDPDFRAQRPEPRRVTGPLVAFDLDDVLSGDPPRPVVIPTQAEPVAPAASPAIAIPEEAPGFDLVTGDSGNISAPATPEDSRDGRYMDFLLQEDPGTGPPPLSPQTWPRTGPIPITAAPAPPPPVADDDDIDRVLARVFAPGVDAHGEVPGIDAGSESGQRVSGTVAEQGQSSLPVSGSSAHDRPVPEGLRGMDAGTADLLSSLEELENSLPDGGPPSADLRADSTWTATTGFGELTGQALQEIDTSVPFIPPPPPEDEQTLQEVLASLSIEAQPTAEEIDPALSSPPVQFDAFRQTGTQFGLRGRTGSEVTGHGTVPREEDPAPRPRVENAVAVSSRALLTGALVAVLLLALAAGGWYLFVRESSVSRPGSRAEPVEKVDRAGSTPPPAAPAPAPGKKKPKKVTTGSVDAGLTRPVPGGEKKPARGVSPAPTKLGPTGTPPRPVATAPQARPEPQPAAMRAIPRDPSPAVEKRMSAADSSMSAADIAPAAPAPVSPPTEGLPPASLAGGAADSLAAPIVRASELDSPVRNVSRAVPPPTAGAIAARSGGRAFLNVLVGGDGSVQEVRLMIDPGHGLGEAARRAAQSWSYTAPLREGQPVRVWKTEVVEFEPPADESGDGAESR